MIKAIIFDLFGVIRPDPLVATYRYFGGDPEKDAYFINDTIDAANRGTIPNSRSVFARHFGITVEQWMEIGDKAGNDQRVLQYVLHLRQTYKTGLLTNISRGRLPELFKPGELEKYFDAVVGSGDVGFAKPEAQAYEIMADRLKVRLDECVMIDDREEYLVGARGVGMRAILYGSLPQLKQELGKLGVQ
jgi:HAD superfamily hydrolase (TIGR01549 family)